MCASQVTSTCVFSMTVVATALRHKILLEYGKHPNFAAVGKKLRVDPRTVKRWVMRSESGALQEKPRSGRKPLVSEAAASKAEELLMSGKYHSCKQVAAELAELGLTARAVDAAQYHATPRLEQRPRGHLLWPKGESP